MCPRFCPFHVFMMLGMKDEEGKGREKERHNLSDCVAVGVCLHVHTCVECTWRPEDSLQCVCPV